MKFTMICLSLFVAAASSAPQFPVFPAVGTPLLPFQPCAQDELGRLIPSGGLVYPGPQENIQIGSWPWGPMGLTPFYPTDPRFLVLPGTGFPVSPAVTSKVIKPTVPVTQQTTRNDKSKMEAIIKEVPKPVAPVPPNAAKESKPKELLSSTPTVAERSRCLQDYRAKKYEVPAEGVQLVGSKITSKKQFPFMVALFHYNDKVKDFALYCGASLISPTQILTAAHCVTIGQTNRVINANRFQIKLGMHFLNETTNDAQLSRSIIKIKIHEEYYTDDFTILNDIAILTMDEPVEYTDTISPVCLVPDCLNDDNELDVTAMGWGNTILDGEKSDFLRYADISTFPNSKCRKFHSNLVDDQMFCAYKDGQDACQNDSGGPLIIDVNKGRLSGFENSCRFMQVGIVSHGDSCTKKGFPGIYTRIKNYLPWILTNSN